MSEESPRQPGPGWWMASDGKLYPPEAHPGVPPVPTGSAGTEVPPVTQPAGGIGQPAAVPAAVLGAAAALAVVAVAVFGYWFLNRLPSKESDKEVITAALPSSADVPPGLIPGSELDLKKSSDSPCVLDVVPTRADASVLFFEAPDRLGDKGFGIGGVSFESDDDASKLMALASPANLASCLGTKLEVTPTTGGVKNADESKVWIAGGGSSGVYLALARTGRFVFLSLAAKPEKAIELPQTAIEKL